MRCAIVMMVLVLGGCGQVPEKGGKPVLPKTKISCEAGGECTCIPFAGSNPLSMPKICCYPASDAAPLDWASCPSPKGP